ncbi:MAG: rod shape-determining protein MreC [Syntrophothermus sp.]
MSRTLDKRRGLIISGVVIFLLISLVAVTSRDRPQATWFERMVRDALIPLQSVLSNTTYGIAKNLAMFRELGRLRAENQALRAEVSRLQTANSQMEEYRRENQRWKKLLDFREASVHKLLAAQVVARDTSNWFNTLVINKGEADGVKKGMPVISDEGVVGQVRQVNPHSSVVLLILDSKSAVGGQIQESRDFVLVEGSTDRLGTGEVKPLGPHTKLRKGDHVVTSGLGEVFPKGLPLGRIEQVTKGRFGLSAKGILTPAVNFARLEEVFVVVRVSTQLDEGAYPAYSGNRRPQEKAQPAKKNAPASAGQAAPAGQNPANPNPPAENNPSASAQPVEKPASGNGEGN